MIIDLSQKAGEDLAAASSGNVVFLCADVTRTTAWEDAGKLAISSFGTLTTVINNAGITADPRVGGIAYDIDKTLLLIYHFAAGS